jgi:protein SCO1/2
MRRNTLLTSPLALALAVTLWGLLIDGARAEHPAHTSHGELPTGASSPHSLYHADSTWITESGQHLRLGDLRGKIRVLAMAYTSCEYACPIVVETMKRLEASLPPELHAQVGFVVVTFDPERDTPAVLKAYSEKRQLDLQHWTLLQGQPDDVLELAVLLGVRYQRAPQGGFAHSNLITVLNKDGEIVHRHLGVQQNLDEALSAIRKAAADS